MLTIANFGRYLTSGIISVIMLIGCTHSPNPNSHRSLSDARSQVALAYLEQYQYSLAKQNLDQAVEYDKNYFLPYLLLARYYQLTGILNQAEEYYQLAMTKAPDEGKIYNNYGAFLCQQERYTSGIEMLNKALNIDEYYHQAQTYQNIALCAYYAGNTELKDHALQKLAHLDPALHTQLMTQLK